MQSEAQKEHHWLQQLVGEWTYEGEASSGGDKPAETFKGTETVRSLGGLWAVCEGHGAMSDGGKAETRMTLGFDPDKGRFVGTWIGSMMSYLWVYDGELNQEGTVLTLNAEGPSFASDGKTAPYKDVIEIKTPDHRVLTSHTLGEDGQWRQFMTVHYRRKA